MTEFNLHFPAIISPIRRAHAQRQTLASYDRPTPLTMRYDDDVVIRATDRIIEDSTHRVWD